MIYSQWKVPKGKKESEKRIPEHISGRMEICGELRMEIQDED